VRERVSHPAQRVKSISLAAGNPACELSCDTAELDVFYRRDSAPPEEVVDPEVTAVPFDRSLPLLLEPWKDRGELRPPEAPLKLGIPALPQEPRRAGHPLARKPAFAIQNLDARLGLDRQPGEMGWLPPPLDGIAMCQAGGVTPRSRKDGNRDEGYDDWGRSGKELLPDPRGIDGRACEVPPKALALAVSELHGRAGPRGRRYGGLWRRPSLGL
jgi:hypothetical protein